MAQESVTLSELEKKALKMIIEAGEKGLLQQDLWKRLNIDSRDGSRIALRLAKKKLITRELVTVKGRKTYRLIALVDKVPEEGKEEEEKKEVTYERRLPRAPKLEVKVNLKSILTIPCTRCPHLKRCAPGQFYDPAKCPKLTAWLQMRVAKLQQRRGATQAIQ